METKKMKSYLLTLFLLFLFSAAHSQDENYLITNKGERVILYNNEEDPFMLIKGNSLYGNMNLTANQVFYFDKEGKQRRISHNKVKELHFNGRNYVNLPIRKSGTPRLHEVIATNDKYVLTQYFHNGYFFYIFDKNKEQALELDNHHSNKKEEDLELLNNVIARYFSDCSKLMSHLKGNVENGNYKNRVKNIGSVTVLENILLKGVFNLKCR